MAPITATTAGIPPQTIDDPELISLLHRLRAIRVTIPDVNVGSTDGDVDMDGGKESMEGVVERIAGELEGIKAWRFPEQVSRLMDFCDMLLMGLSKN